MSLKLFCLLAVLTLCAIVIITEARDGRDHRDPFAKQAVDEKFARHRSRHRHSSHKSTSSHSSSRSHKSHGTDHSSNSSPVSWASHKSTSGHSSSRSHKSHDTDHSSNSSHKSTNGHSSSRSHKSHDTDHSSNSNPGFWARLFNTESSSNSHTNKKHDTAHENHNSHTVSDIVVRDQKTQSSSNRRKSQKQDTDHNSHTVSDIVVRDQNTLSSSNPRKSQKQDTDHVNHNSHTTFNEQSQHNSHNWHPLSSSAPYHGTLTASPHASNNWGGHQLPPGHVYVTQPSSIPANAVYYAQPPTHANTDDSSAFDWGYLVGRSLTRRRHHHHHHHHYHERQPQAQANNEKQTKVVIVENQMNPTGVAPTTNQTNYWPTESETPLAPLNNTLVPNGVSQPTVPIFKNPAIESAQNVIPEDFKLPTATAAPPETPPTNGIICMPWNFNERDPTNPENVIVVQKTICFPAPPPPPPEASPAAPLEPNAGGIGLNVSTTPTAATA